MNKYILLLSLSTLLAACGEKATEQTANSPVSPTQTNASAETTIQAGTAAAEAIQTSTPVTPVDDKAILTAEAKTAVQTFAGKLKGELQAGMKAGGPGNALNICHIRAPEIAKAVSSEKGLHISRTSLKVRNPNNAPNEWQTKVLNEFEAQKAAGKDPASIIYSEIAGDEFRFMKAIPTDQMCLNCHGSILSPDVTAKLTELYPQDKATGFREGDLRGAFVVVKNLAQ